MYQKILVPLDGSPCAEAILTHVEKLAACLNAEVIFLQVVEPVVIPVSPEGFSYVDVEEKIQAQVITNATRYLTSVQETFMAKNINTNYLIEDGSVVSTILDVAQEQDVDLIMMASHGRTGLSRMFYGSVAESLLHEADRPLLLVRSDEED